MSLKVGKRQNTCQNLTQRGRERGWGWGPGSVGRENRVEGRDREEGKEEVGKQWKEEMRPFLRCSYS